MKCIHIFKNTNETFSEPYIDLINENFGTKEHFFYYLGKDYRTNKTDRCNIQFVFGFLYYKLIKDMYIADKIFLHGLNSPKLVLLLFIQPWLLCKCHWVIWGSDLYYYKFRSKTFRANLYERLRRKVIKNMGALITYIKGDYNLAQKWYGAKGMYYYSIMYPSNMYKEYNLSTETENSKMVVQIGNSADPSNNHIEVLEKLKRYKDENIEIICPLSYGNNQYRNEVILKGEELFGQKFKPLIDFLPLNQYLNLLAQVNVAIFNHKRQQGMGNIITLLGLGKKVYIRDDITTWELFKELNIKVFSANAQFEDLFKIFDEKDNKKIVKEYFSEEKLKNDWYQIFKSGVV